MFVRAVTKMQNNNRLLVAVAAHKRYYIPPDSCYVPLHVGKALHEDEIFPGYLGDDSGENISTENLHYCELTGLYWMWKNTSSEYLGLVHYRRHFRTSQFSLWKSRAERIIRGDELLELLKGHSLILPRKRHYVIETVFSHYAHTHYEIHLTEMRRIIQKDVPEYLEAFDKVINRRSGHICNMFVMKRELAEAYCSWLFPLLSKLETSIDDTEYDEFQKRFIGRVGERLLDVWVEKNQISYRELPVINLEPVHWWKKGTAFLAAKFLGKKYTASF